MDAKRDHNISHKGTQEIDSCAIVENLKLNHQQRIVKHQNALDLVIQLKNAGLKFYGKSQSVTKKTS